MRNDQNEDFRPARLGRHPGAGRAHAGAAADADAELRISTSRSISTNIRKENVSPSRGMCRIFRRCGSADGQDYSNFPTTGQNSSRQCPRTTTTYILRVQMQDGTVTERQITIFVEPSNTAPKITYFSVKPTSVQAGQCVQVTGWLKEA